MIRQKLGRLSVLLIYLVTVGGEPVVPTFYLKQKHLPSTSVLSNDYRTHYENFSADTEPLNVNLGRFDSGNDCAPVTIHEQVEISQPASPSILDVSSSSTLSTAASPSPPPPAPPPPPSPPSAFPFHLIYRSSPNSNSGVVSSGVIPTPLSLPVKTNVIPGPNPVNVIEYNIAFLQRLLYPSSRNVISSVPPPYFSVLCPELITKIVAQPLAPPSFLSLVVDPVHAPTPLFPSPIPQPAKVLTQSKILGNSKQSFVPPSPPPPPPSLSLTQSKLAQLPKPISVAPESSTIQATFVAPPPPPPPSFTELKLAPSPALEFDSTDASPKIENCNHEIPVAVPQKIESKAQVFVEPSVQSILPPPPPPPDLPLVIPQQPSPPPPQRNMIIQESVPVQPPVKASVLAPPTSSFVPALLAPSTSQPCPSFPAKNVLLEESVFGLIYPLAGIHPSLYFKRNVKE